MWIYNSANGNLSRSGELVGSGYSGFQAGKNNPKLEHLPMVGPIPRGAYTIELPAFSSEEHGPVCFRLTPKPGTNTYGRCLFMLHGDSIAHAGSASHGCIVQPRPARLKVDAIADPDLEVV